MRQDVAAAFVVLLLTGTLSDLLLVAGSSRNKGRPRFGFQPKSGIKPKKGLSNKAKIAAAGVAGVAGGMFLGSVLSGRRFESQLRNNQYQKINETWADGRNNVGVVYPLAHLWLVSSMFLTHCVSL